MPKSTVHPDLVPDYLDNGRKPPSRKEPDPPAIPSEHARTHHRLKPFRANDSATPPPAAPDTSNPYDSQPVPKKKKPASEWG